MASDVEAAAVQMRAAYEVADDAKRRAVLAETHWLFLELKHLFREYDGLERVSCHTEAIYDDEGSYPLVVTLTARGLLDAEEEDYLDDHLRDLGCSSDAATEVFGSEWEGEITRERAMMYEGR